MPLIKKKKKPCSWRYGAKRPTDINSSVKPSTISNRRLHTRCCCVTGVQTCALPISGPPGRVSRRAGIMRSSPLAGVRVLLVDDDELVREALHDYFVECGAVVVAAASARAALKAFMQAPPAVLVSDLRMPPGEDGFWLIAAIRALKPSQGGEVPAVAVTGDVMAASQAMAAGFQAVHGKPPKLPDLAALVGRLAGVP